MITETVQDLTRKEYDLFRELIYKQCGINLGDQKMQLVRARLGKRMRTGGFKSYREYYQFVRDDQSGQELMQLIDAISTNTTHLFRENRHFEFLAETVREWEANKRERRSPIRIWSAGCSSGEEPYSIAMTMDDLKRKLPSLQFKILATDISTRVLQKAQKGLFDPGKMSQVPAEFMQRYFTSSTHDGQQQLQVRPEIRGLIRFARLNLMDTRFPFRNGLDLIFCRNVMIYFDKPTQEGLVARFASVLSPGGYLLIGHSESLNNISHPLTYVAPTVYQKK